MNFSQPCLACATSLERFLDSHPLLLLLYCSPLGAMCIAHVAALRAWPTPLPAGLQSDDHTTSVMYGMAAAIGVGPAALSLDPALQQMFAQLWAGLPPAVSSLQHVA